MGNKEKLNQENIIKNFEEELSKFKEEVEKSQKWSNINLSKYNEWLYSWFSDLKNNVDENDKKELDNILNKLKNNEKINIDNIVFLEKILEKLKNKQLEQSELKKIQESINHIRSVKWNLKKLAWNIWSNTEVWWEIKEAKKKIEKYKHRINKLAEDHPIRAKVIINMLPDKLKFLFAEKSELPKTPPNNFWEKIKYIINKLTTRLSSVVVPIFAALFTFIAPKEIKSLFSDMKEDLWKIDDSVLNHFWWNFSEVTKKLTKKEEKEVSKIESRFIVNIPKQVKKISWKTMTEEQAKYVVKKLDLKNYFKNNIHQIKEVTNSVEWKDFSPDANYAKAFGALIGLPFKLFFRLTSILHKEWFINITDIWVYFLKKTCHIFLWSFYVLWTWIEVISWKTSTDKLVEKVKRMLNEEPETWKKILSIMLYRHWWLIFSFLWEISNYIWKAAIYWLSWETKLLESLSSSFKWNIDEYLRVLDKLKWIMPEDLNLQWIQNFKVIINKLEEANNSIKILSSNPNINGKKFIELYKKDYGYIPSFVWTNNNLLEAFEKLDSTWLRANIASEISGIWNSLDREKSKIKAVTWKLFLWINSESAILDDISKHIQSTTKSLAEIVRNDDLWSKFKSQLFKLGLMKNVLSIDNLYDKWIYRFQNVENFKDFILNLKILAKQSPELVRFLFDKFPIFVVWWLSISEDKNIKDIAKDLIYLIPFFWSWYMLVNSMNVKNPNLEQAWISSVLLWTETWYALFQVYKNWIKEWWKNIVKFITKPFVDVAEIFSFFIKSRMTIIKIKSDFNKLLIAWKLNKYEFKKVLREFPKISSKKWLVITLLVLWSYYWINKLFSDEIGEFAKECKKWEKIDTACLDKKIKDNRWKLSDDEKAEIIALSYWIKANNPKWIEWEYKDWTYKIILNKEYWTIPNKSTLEKRIAYIKDILRKYDNKEYNIKVVYKRNLIKKVVKERDLNTDWRKIKQYFLALWFSEQDTDIFLKEYNSSFL